MNRPLRILALSLTLTFAACHGGGNPSRQPSDQKQGENKQNGKGSIHIEQDAQQRVGIRVVRIEPRQISETLQVPGQIAADEQRTSHIGSIVQGRVVDIVAFPGQHVKRGTVLARIHSHEVHETVGALDRAFADLRRQQAAVQYAQQLQTRYQHLYAIQAASLEENQRAQQQLVQAQTDLKSAEANLRMEREHLSELLQVPPISITPETLHTQELVPLRSPIAGTVITRSITPGQVVEPGVEAYTVSDLQNVWMIASVDERNISRVRQGDTVIVRTQAYPGMNFRGRVTLVGEELDPKSRTLPVRISVPNPQRQLRPAMFADATISEGSTRKAMFIPEDAVQDINGVQVVFVTGNGTDFQPQAVKLGPVVAHQTEVLDGLQPGATVAVSGTFLLKSELLRDTLQGD
jgi:membrane fusion protein, heavy metal efflux system